jgi:hypothetical protein
MDPNPDADPNPNPVIFLVDLQDAKKNNLKKSFLLIIF